MVRSTTGRVPAAVALGLVLAALPNPPCLAAEKAGGGPRTYAYKTVGDCKIEADVYLPAAAPPRPVLVWIHGGALIVGNRRAVPRRLIELAGKEGYLLVSLDYRLAPEAKLPAIIEDLVDAIGWIRREGPQAFGADPGKLVIAGGSAGGYLTISAGVWVKPPPTALVAYWGYGDMDGEWATKPSPHHGTPQSLMPMAKIRKYIGHGVISGTNAENQSARGQFYRYLRQQGLWAKVVSGFDPETEAARFDPYCPVRRITPDYPPILLIHGTSDTDVPYAESAEMARRLARCGVAHQLITVPHAGHGLQGGDARLVAEAHARALEFIRQHLQ